MVALMIAGLFFGVSLTDTDIDVRAQYIQDQYLKSEEQVVMRDGVRLFTSIYTPKDQSKKHPILMVRTPYQVNPYGEAFKTRLGPSAAYEEAGYIFVFQDVRGRFMSEGSYVNMRPHLSQKVNQRDIDESTDTYDTISWLLEHVEGNNGRVGMWGISYPGFYSSAGMIDSHPALKAVSPQACIADWYWDDMHHHGALSLNLTFAFFSVFGVDRPELTTEWSPRFQFNTPDGYDFFLELGPLKNVNERHFNDDIEFWNQLMAHPNYDHFWQSRNIIPHLKNITTAVLVVGGWFDAEDLYGPLKTYASVEAKNPKADNRIIMGPWSHGGWHRMDGSELGDARFGEATSPDYQAIEFQWFQHYLQDGPASELPEAMMFETGSNRWREFDRWPPEGREQQAIYMHANGRIELAPPDGRQAAYSSYQSDPSKPVPYTKKITTMWEKTYMTEDQRFASQRPDVLVFESDVLTEDLTIAGPMMVDLWVSTSESDADWVVKLIDQYPDVIEGVPAESEDYIRGGMQQMVRGDIFRGRYRDSYSNPIPFKPGEVTRVKFELQDILHRFKKGHRVMVQIQSSWFPLFDRNPQRFVENINLATEQDFVSATHKVYHSADHASRIEIGVLRDSN